jgi:DHA1 family bicyclomycin/chloramphenicol resistance-like MFS transporter
MSTPAMAAAPGFSPLVGGALDHFFGWRSAFAFVAIFAAVAAIAYFLVFEETHRVRRAAFAPMAIAKSCWSLSTDRRFVIPAATVSLIVGALFAMFSALPRVSKASGLRLYNLVFFRRHGHDRV